MVCIPLRNKDLITSIPYTNLCFLLYGIILNGRCLKAKV